MKAKTTAMRAKVNKAAKPRYKYMGDWVLKYSMISWAMSAPFPAYLLESALGWNWWRIFSLRLSDGLTMKKKMNTLGSMLSRLMDCSISSFISSWFCRIHFEGLMVTSN